jgi:hypothetical protein
LPLTGNTNAGGRLAEDDHPVPLQCLFEPGSCVLKRGRTVLGFPKPNGPLPTEDLRGKLSLGQPGEHPRRSQLSAVYQLPTSA